MSGTSRRDLRTAANATPSSQTDLDPVVVQAAREVDRSLLEWSLSLSPRQRLRACSNAVLALARFTRGSSAQADLDALIQALLAAKIEFIVAGGAAAVLHGVPITTQDLHIVHCRTAENVQRLAQLLVTLDAKFRGRNLR